MARSKSVTTMTFARITPEIREMINVLSKAWGPVVPLNDSDVIRVAIRRVFEAEEKKSKKSAKQTLDGA